MLSLQQIEANPGAFFAPLSSLDPILCCLKCKRFAFGAQECLGCENLFCSTCVADVKQKNNKCPQNCNGQFQTKLPHRLVRQRLSSALFSCANKKDGCKEELSSENLLTHFQICPFALTVCACSWKGNRNNFDSHKSFCAHHKLQTCDICKAKIAQALLATHNCTKELLNSLNKIQEQFYDYKEQSEYAIKDLKMMENQRQQEIGELKKYLNLLLDENNCFKKTIQELNQRAENLKKRQESKNESPVKQVQQQQQQSSTPQQQQQYQQQYQQQRQQQQISLITKGQLVESQAAKCEKQHKLYFWKNSQGEEKQKQCQKCQNSNKVCRYICKECQTYICLKCYYPELKICINTSQTFCPTKHLMKKIEEKFKCSVCDKNGEDMIQPVAFYCDQCDFKECFQCIKNKKYHEIE